MKRVVGIITLGAAFVLAGVGCGGGTSAFARHRILLVGHDNDAARIFVWSPGSPAEPLTGPQPWGSVHQSDWFVGLRGASWSPDGRSIAYEEDGNDWSLFPPSYGVFVMRADGTHTKLFDGGLGQGGGVGGLPSWSPDGRQIVWRPGFYIGDTLNTKEKFVIDNVHGGQRTWPADSVADDGTNDPVWGKPGIAYFLNSRIMLLNPATGRSRLVTDRFHEGPLAWSPRGVLALGEPRKIVFLAASGRVLRELPLPLGAKNVCGIAWDPQGTQILVQTGDKSGADSTGLWVRTPSTKQWQSLPAVPTWRNYKYSCGVSWR